jgi:hypothetical protein
VETFYKRFYFRAPKIASIVGEMVRSPQMMKRRLREGVEFFQFLRERHEIYSHPATTRDATLTRLMPDYRHDAELAALLSKLVGQLVAKSGIELTTYAALTAAR